MQEHLRFSYHTGSVLKYIMVKVRIWEFGFELLSESELWLDKRLSQFYVMCTGTQPQLDMLFPFFHFLGKKLNKAL